MINQKTGFKFSSAIAAIFFLVVCVIYVTRMEFSSDSAIASIIGHDIASGNILLQNWFLSNESFFTTDYLLHGVIFWFLRDVQFTGYLCRIIIICLSFSAVLLLSKNCVTNKEYYIYAIPAYMILIIASRFIFCIPNHHAAIAFCLFAAYFYFPANRTGNILFIILLFWAVVGDKYSLIYLAFPLLAESIFYSLSKRIFERRILMLPIILVLAFTARYALENYYYKVPGLALNFVEFEKLSHNIYLYIGSLFKEPGAWFWGGSPTSPQTIYRLCLTSLPLAAVSAPILLRRSPNRIVRFLCFSSFFVSAGFILSDAPQTLNESRYLMGLFFNGSILITVLLSNKTIPVYCQRLAQALALLLPGVFLAACFLMPPNTNKVDAHVLAQALIEHDLSYGYADYWATYSISFAANNLVRIAPIKPSGSGYASPKYACKNDWYSEWPGNFVIRDGHNPGTETTFSEQNLRSGFGEPIEIFRVGDRWTVYVYDHDLHMKLRY
jgi:hypothetical protein